MSSWLVCGFWKVADALYSNRMDSGLLESVSMPYALHSVMRSMFIPLQLATDARGLKFVTELDRSIDIVSNLVSIHQRYVLIPHRSLVNTPGEPHIPRTASTRTAPNHSKNS